MGRRILKPIADYFPQIRAVLPVGTEMWRSRTMKKRERPYSWGGWGFAKPDDAVRALIEEDRPRTAEKLGPPPIRLSKNSRMSPAGISYTYLASDQETCCSEIRPNVGDYVWSGRFETTQALVIVDLTSVRKARPRSLFATDFVPDEVGIRSFLLEFAAEISMPVAVEDSALDYVPSQVLCELIRSSGYHGIAFRSSLFDLRDGPQATHTNYVLFCGPSSTPGDRPQAAASVPHLPCFSEWLKLRVWQGHTITAVRYEQRMARGSHGGGDVMPYD